MSIRHSLPTTGRSRNRRWWLWLPMLGAACWLAFWGDKTPVNATVSGSPTHSTSSSAIAQPFASGELPPAQVSAPPGALEALVPRNQLVRAPDEAAPPESRDLFAIRTWSPPAISPAPSVEASPAAPPLPYVYVGKKHEERSWEVYLVRGDQTFIVRDGQTIEGQYKVEHIAPPVLTLTYLPLGQTQSLVIGDEL